VEIGFYDIGGQRLRVGIRHGDKARPPLLFFNGIGANIELTEPFFAAFDGPEAIVFDIPGVGGSPAPRLPYRPSTLARLTARLLDQLGHAKVDVLGVSWGGALAQQFAFQQSKRCRRLILAATSPGHLMVPGKPGVLLKMRRRVATRIRSISGKSPPTSMVEPFAIRRSLRARICATSNGRATMATICSSPQVSAGAACPGCRSSSSPRW